VHEVERGYSQFARKNYSAANDRFRHACQLLSLFDWVGRKYLKIQVDLANSTSVLSLHRVSDTRLEMMLRTDEAERDVPAEEQHKTEIFHRVRAVLAFLRNVPESEVDMEALADPVILLLHS
jgi:hypothetical protein